MNKDIFLSDSMTEHWRMALLPESATVSQAILNLETSGLQIALVTRPDDQLVGTITDGDIRRGLLRGVTLDSPASEVVHSDPLVAPVQLSRDMVLHLMQANKLHQLPVVDAAGRVVGLYLWNYLIAPTHRDNLMVIMAGGFGTRLRPHTDNCPKPLLRVAGKPMLEHIIERAKANGFSRFVITTHYLGHMIEEYFGDGARHNVHIRYVRENSPLGTGGAVSLLDPFPVTPFVVCNGDVLTDINYAELLDFHMHSGAAATMAVRLHEWQHPFGVVHAKGSEIIGFEEKPVHKSLVNAGIYVLSPESMAFLNHGEQCDIPTLFTRLRLHGDRTVVYPIHEPWLDVGREEDYIAADERFSNPDR